MHVHEALRARISSNHYDPTHTMTEAEITELVNLAVEAPSSYNIQHTRLVAVTDPAQKKALRAAAYNQPKVEEAAVCFVVLGDMLAHEAFATRIRAAVAAGHFDAAVAEGMLGQVGYVYGNPAMQRDEALRSAGLLAMALLLAAEERGLASGPMIGFVPDAVSAVIGAEARYVPLMLIAVGRGLPGNGPRKPRLQADAVLRFNKASF